MKRASHLTELDNDCPLFLHLERELRVEEPGDPPHRHACPLLHDSPVVIEQSRAVEQIKTLEEVFVRHPEEAIVAELVVQFLHPIWIPLTRPI